MSDTSGSGEPPAAPCPVAETMQRVQRDLERGAARTFEALLVHAMEPRPNG